MVWAPATFTVDSAGLTTTTPTYTSGDQLGTEITIPSIVTANNRLAVITGITLVDDGDVMGASELWFFFDSTTPASNNSPAAWSDADAAKVIPGGVVFCPTPIDVGGARVSAVPNLWIPFQSGSGHDDLFLNIVTRTNNGVFAAVDDLHVRLSVLQYTP